MLKHLGGALVYRTFQALFALLVLLYCSSPVKAQTPTLVTGTITDTNGLPYSEARVSAQLIPSTASPTIIVNGIPVGIAGQQNASSDSGGNFTMNLFCNSAGGGCSVISPAGTQWQITVNTNGVQRPFGTGPQSCTATVTITGASQDLSATFSTCPALTRTLPAGAGGTSGQAQVNNGGVLGGTPCLGFPNISTGPANVDCDFHSKGPNPYVDVTRYGVRAMNPNVAPAINGITASCNGTTTITLSAASTFQNGDSIIIYGCGAAHAMATPAAPTVTPSLARVMTGTRDTIAGPAGATTYNYCVAWRDLFGGMTACSPTGTTTTGQASLGKQTVALTSLSRATDTVSAISAAHTLATNAMVVIIPTTAAQADNSWNGWFKVASAADTTHFTYTSGQDVRNGAITTPTASFTGNAIYFNANHVTFGAAPTGGLQPYIYTAGGALIGPAWPTNPSSSTFTDLAFDDFGSTMMGNLTSTPAYVPATAPASATNDALITTIVSGAGTTTLTVADAAGNTLSGQTILLDNCKNLQAVMTANYAFSSGPPLYFPVDPSGNFYVFNSVCDLRAQNPTLAVSGGVQFNDTLLLGSGKINGVMLPQKGSALQFQSESLIRVGCKAIPCIYMKDDGRIEGVEFDGNGNQNVIVLLDGGGAHTGPFFDRMNVATGGGITDLMGIGFLCRGVTADGCSFQMANHITINGGSNGDASTATPGMLVAGSSGIIKIDHITLSGRGLLFYGGDVSISWMYRQAGRMPLVTYSGLYLSASNTSFNLRLGQVLQDTEAMPTVAYLVGAGSATGNIQLPTSFNGPSSSVPVMSGTRSALVQQASFIPSGSAGGQNRDTNGTTSANCEDGIFVVNNVAACSLFVANQSIKVATSQSVFVEGQRPTNVTCSVSAGGGVSIGTHTYKIAAVWGGNSLGLFSDPSASCTTSSGQQTVTVSWTAPPGNPIGYDLVEDTSRVRNTSSPGATCATPQLPAGTVSFALVGDVNCGAIQPSISAGGPTMLMPGVQGIATPALTIAGTPFVSLALPTISTHFNTSGDSIAATSTATFQITVGTGAGTSTGAITLPTTLNGWNCTLSNKTRAAYIQQTGDTATTATFTNYGTTFAATNWTNSDVLYGSCFPR